VRAASATAGTTSLSIEDVTVSVVRKRVKNVNLRVYPPAGDVVVSVPLRMPEGTVRAVVAGRLPWIRQQRSRYRAVPAVPFLEYVDGEEHWLAGERHVLRLVHGRGTTGIAADGRPEIALHVQPFASHAARQRAYDAWLRTHMRALSAELVGHWAPVMGVRVPQLGIKRMKTRWGTCNHREGRVWLNLELVRRPPACLEYVVVHELAHLIVPNHSRSFWAVVDRHLPDWRESRAELGRWPLWADGRLPDADGRAREPGGGDDLA